MDITVLLNSLGAAWRTISTLALNGIIALVLLLVGLLVARGLGKLVTIVFNTLRLDKLAKQVGFTSILDKGNIKRTSSELLGDLVYWVTALVVIISVLSFFGLAVESALARVFSFIAIVILASLILGVGVFLAGLISAIVRMVMANFELEGSKITARIVYYIIVIFAFLAALAELGIPSEAFVPHLGIFIGAPALAVAIAFGLGCKDMAADFLHNLFKGK